MNEEKNYNCLARGEENKYHVRMVKVGKFKYRCEDNMNAYESREVVRILRNAGFNPEITERTALDTYTSISLKVLGQRILEVPKVH